MGLIGHNGAGKSTTIKSLVSIISPSSGRILVDGQELSENRLAIKRKIGYVADSPDLFLRLTANEFWELIVSSYDLTSSDLEASLARLLNVFDFAENRYQVIGNPFSRNASESLCHRSTLVRSRYLGLGRTLDRFGSPGCLLI